MTCIKVLFLVLSFFVYQKYANAEPVAGCTSGIADQYGNSYISDDTNPCIFYWCMFNNFVSFGNGPMSFHCPPPYGTRFNSTSDGDLCVVKLQQCGFTTTVSSQGRTTATPATTTERTRTTPSISQTPVRSPGHALGGRRMEHTDVNTCLRACFFDPNCQAADFNHQQRTCWFHDEACKELQFKPSCIHYSFRECTTTTSTTTIPQTSTTTPAQSVTFPQPAMSRGHAQGGRYTVYSTVQDCLQACFFDPECQAADFNNQERTCWHHDTACKRLRFKPYCVHYSFQTCSVSTTPSPTPTTTTLSTSTATTTGSSTTTSSSTTPSSSSPTSSPIVETIGNSNVQGGIKNPNIRDIDQCLAYCRTDPDCEGFDFDLRDRTCWIHNSSSVCNDPEEKIGCTHFKLTQRCIVTTPAPEDRITEVLDNRNVEGGVKNPSIRDLDLCLQNCATDPDCSGFDFDFRDLTCWFHSNESICNTPEEKFGCKHFKLTSLCVTPTTTTTMASEPQRIFPDMNVPGAIKDPAIRDLDICNSTCQQNPTCAGFDFDFRDFTCWFHDSNSICNDPVTKVGCTHYKLTDQCDGNGQTSPISSQTTMQASNAPTGSPGFIAPTNGFITLNFAGPTVLPSGWSAYPGVQVQNGIQIGNSLTGDECIQECQDDDQCLGIDFNSFDGSCYVFPTESVKCSPLVAANLVYHAIKAPLCADPYPPPLATAP